MALIPILVWLLGEHDALPVRTIQRYDPAVFRRPRKTLDDRIDHAVENFPCDLLFIHRDGDRLGLEAREEEVRRALGASKTGAAGRPLAVLTVPIRMTEAWLLFDEGSIRSAAGRPKGKTELDLPSIGDCERIADPKGRLHQSLRTATEKTGRHLRRFNPDSAVHRVAELITDYAPLRSLLAFQKLEANLDTALDHFTAGTRGNA